MTSSGFIELVVFFRPLTPIPLFYVGTEGGRCQTACHPQWFFYVPNGDGTDINMIIQFMKDTQFLPNVDSQICTPNIPCLP